MKTRIMLAAALATTTLTACQSPEATTGISTAVAGEATVQAVAVEVAPAPEQIAPAVTTVEQITLAAATVTPEGKGRWRVSTRITNDGATPVTGFLLVYSLAAPDAPPFARQSVEVRLNAPLAAGATIPWESVSVPVDMRPAGDVAAKLDVVKLLDAQSSLDSDGWKPLDLARATPVTVSGQGTRQ